MKPMPPARVKVPFLWPLVACLLFWFVMAFLFTSCQSMPPVTVEGQYGTYHYDSKAGLVVKPKPYLPTIRIHPDK